MDYHVRWYSIFFITHNYKLFVYMLKSDKWNTIGCLSDYLVIVQNQINAIAGIQVPMPDTFLPWQSTVWYYDIIGTGKLSD